jgi:hypothetical protein
METQANKKRRDIQFAVGDWSWLKTDHLVLPPSLSRKLAAKWIGPYQIKKVINPVAMELQLPSNLRLHPVFHVSNLKPHLG